MLGMYSRHLPMHCTVDIWKLGIYSIRVPSPHHLQVRYINSKVYPYMYTVRYEEYRTYTMYFTMYSSCRSAVSTACTSAGQHFHSICTVFTILVDAGHLYHRYYSWRSTLSQSVRLQETSVTDWTVAGQDCHRVYSCSIRLLQTVQLQHTIVIECTAAAYDCYKLYSCSTRLL